MQNIIFLLLFVVGIIYGACTGRINLVVDALLSAPKNAFFIFIEIYVLLLFWSGLLKIMSDSGLLNIICKGITKIIHPLFKSLDVDSKALQFISMNFVANIFSMGSAATPFGLKAMEELDKLNNHSVIASNEMITFLLVNASGLCLVPTTLLAIRNQAGSLNSAMIIPYIVIVSSICTISAILLDFGGRHVRKN